MSILGREAEAFVRSQSERTIPLLGKYVTKVPARVESVTGVPPDQKAVVATPDQIAALASGEITSIPRPAMPVYGSVEPGEWVWCLADAAGLHVMGTPGSSEGTGGGGSGTPGKDGKTVLNGAGAPPSSVGVAGDFYVDTQNSRFYGPKATDAGTWPTTFIMLLGRGVPAGGTTGQVLTKVDADDYDTRWSDPTGGTGGGATGSPVVKARVERITTAQAIPSGTWTVINWNAETQDPDNWWVSSNSTRFTPPAGEYLVFALSVFVNNASGIRSSRIRKNGSEVVAQSQVTSAQAVDVLGRTVISGSVTMLSGDYIEYDAFQASGNSLGFGPQAASIPYFELLKIG